MTARRVGTAKDAASAAPRKLRRARVGVGVFVAQAAVVARPALAHADPRPRRLDGASSPVVAVGFVALGDVARARAAKRRQAGVGTTAAYPRNGALRPSRAVPVLVKPPLAKKPAA